MLGVPLYSNAAGTLPIVEALTGKGLPLGSALAARGLGRGDTVAVLLACPPRALAPGESMTCSAERSVVQADLDAGRIDGRTVLCVLTHDPKLDDPAIIAALQAGCRYVGQYAVNLGPMKAVVAPPSTNTGCSSSTSNGPFSRRIRSPRRAM